MDVETVLIHSRGVLVAADVDAVAVVVAVRAPYEIMLPKFLSPAYEPVREERERAGDRVGKRLFWIQRGFDVFRQLRARVFKHIFAYQMPLPVKRSFCGKILFEVPILTVHARLGNRRVRAEAFAERKEGYRRTVGIRPRRKNEYVRIRIFFEHTVGEGIGRRSIRALERKLRKFFRADDHHICSRRYAMPSS